MRVFDSSKVEETGSGSVQLFREKGRSERKKRGVTR